jgi:hypothetical protein
MIQHLSLQSGGIQPTLPFLVTCDDRDTRGWSLSLNATGETGEEKNNFI